MCCFVWFTVGFGVARLVGLGLGLCLLFTLLFCWLGRFVCGLFLFVVCKVGFGCFDFG